MKLPLAFTLKKHGIVGHVWGLRRPPQRRTRKLNKDVYFFVEIRDKEDGLFPFSNIIVNYGMFISMEWPHSHDLIICESQFEMFPEENIQTAFFEEIQDDDKFQEIAKHALKRYLPGF